MKLKIYIISLLFFCFIRALGSGPYYHFKHLSLNEGLPSSVTSVFDDKKGLLWVGTPIGIYKFNGKTMKKYALPRKYSNGSEYINKIIGEENNRIWISSVKGLYYYNYKSDSIETLFYQNKPVISNCLVSIKDGIIITVTGAFIVYNKDLKLYRKIRLSSPKMNIIQLEKFNDKYYLARTDKNKLVLADIHSGKIIPSPFQNISNISKFYKDSSGYYWLTIVGKGVVQCDTNGNIVGCYNVENTKLNNNIILDIKEWEKEIWLSTDGGGINIITPSTQHVEYLSNTQNSSFLANSATCLFQKSNYMWIGLVRESILCFEKGFITTYTKSSLSPYDGLSEKCPVYLLNCNDGLLWIGTDGGGINSFDYRKGVFTHYPLTFGEKNVCLCELSDKELLTSSYRKGLFTFNKKNGQYKAFKMNDKKIDNEFKNSGIAINLYKINKDEIDIFCENIYRYNRKNNTFTKVSHDKTSPNSQWIFIGKDRAVPYFQCGNMIMRYDFNQKKYRKLLTVKNEELYASCIGSNGDIFLSTSKNVIKYSLVNHRSKVINVPGPYNYITSIICDRQGIVWMASLNGLYAYRPETNTFTIYSEMDGVLPNDFLPKPVLVIDNNIYMGGSEGLLRINKDLKLPVKADDVTINLQEVIINGKNIYVPDNKEIEVPYNFRSMDISTYIKDNNVFSKRFYQFKVEGLDNKYIETHTSTLSFYTLPPNSYKISVRCSLNNGKWSNESLILKLRVLPPWWAQGWVKWTLAFIAILIIILLINSYNKRIKEKLKEKERIIYKEKVQALININHELRTPLSLIYNPLKQIVNSNYINKETRINATNAFKHARQMMNLINMILTLRRMEIEKVILQRTTNDFNSCIKNILDDFNTEYSLHHISLLFYPDDKIGKMSFDIHQLELVLSNLLTNAYKFSPDESTVRVYTYLLNDYVKLVVKDEGKGINKEEREHLFTRFYMGNHNLQGYGIGLSYAKQLIELQGGSIGAGNNEDKGAYFFFTLPYKKDTMPATKSNIGLINDIVPPGIQLSGTSIISSDEKYHSLVIIQNDKDMCNYLKENLKNLFTEIYTATDGKEAIPIITSRLPQLIISSVKMNRVNGFELCKYLKQKSELSYIPVILLTSLIDSNSIKEGLEVGAEAYISKPFDLDLLILRIQNIMTNHRIVKKHYALANSVPIDKLNPYKENLILKINHIITENISNQEMDVDFIADKMSMSRASLYNKSKYLIKGGINNYIIEKKMEYARVLLSTTELTIGDISEKAGFKHSRNFSTLFKSKYGKSPSDFRKEIAEK